jgi:hypothetical protein
VELSADKTKREIVNLLTNYQWQYQYSIFFDVSDKDSDTAKRLAIEWFDSFNDIKFRDYLRKTSKTALLFMIRTGFIRNRLDKKTIKQVYITLYCNNKLSLDDVIYNYYDTDEVVGINVMSRKVTDYKINTTVTAIKSQKLHDLSMLSGKKRHSLINKKLLIPVKSILS